MEQTCQVISFGTVEYQAAWTLQARLAEEIAAGARSPTLLLLEHPHTYTFGRRGDAQNLLWPEDELQARGVRVHWVDRGGDVTYHGPGQLVGYPLLPLAPGGLVEPSPGRLPAADYVGYLRKLESTIILALMRLGIVSGQIDGLTGVWVQPDVHSRCRNCPPEMKQLPAKIASIGVKVDVRGVSRHGFAINIDPDMEYWEGIIGCGIKGYPATSVAELQRTPPSMAQAKEAVVQAFHEVFNYRMAPVSPQTVEHLMR